MRIGLLGDTHGNYPWLMYALNKFNREGVTTIIQLGDFGIWPGVRGYEVMKRVNILLRNYGQTLYVIPGNHDDYDQIDALPVAEDGWQHFFENILLAPRGHRWEWGGLSFVALGGAPSVDRARRLSGTHYEGKDPVWWEQEAITPDDVAKVIAGGYADVMVAHDAPRGINHIDRMIANNPHNFEAADLLYAADGRELMTEAFRAVAPRFFFHGHYHFFVSERLSLQREGMFHPCHVLGLANDGKNFSLGEFDTETLQAKPWDIFIDYKRFNFES